MATADSSCGIFPCRARPALLGRGTISPLTDPHQDRHEAALLSMGGCSVSISYRIAPSE